MSDLQPGFITSGSIRFLCDLFHDVREVIGKDVLFDLFLLRDADVHEIEAELGRPLAPNGGPSDSCEISEIMAEDRNRGPIAAWLVKQCQTAGIQVSAFATYFPEISSPTPARRNRAARAIANSLLVAVELAKANITCERQAIVEIVCGSLLDRCKCAACVKKNSTRSYQSEIDDKLNWIVEGLNTAVDLAVASLDNTNDIRLAIGLEIEPGETYVLKNLDVARQLFEKIDEQPRLQQRVGLNVDVAHLRIIPEDSLRDYSADLAQLLPRIVHAHISDHPRMHTRDQPVGDWTSVFHEQGGYVNYLEKLLDRAAQTGTVLPFSRTVALELEGCNRFRWIANGISGIRQCIAMAKRKRLKSQLRKRQSSAGNSTI